MEKPVRKPKYDKSSDEILIPMIRAITDQRATYSYRRVGQLLNIELKNASKRTVNHKRIYRIMKAANQLLTKHTGKKTMNHDGKMITLHSDTRWCSDAFAIQCSNAERVHVAFSLDTCDREAIRYVASTIGVDGAMVRDLMVETVEARFGNVRKLPNKIQWLNDNGPAYVANETVAFVKTFKRDYAWIGDLSRARAVMAQLPKWFEDYNETTPYKCLKMLSPSQFRREKELKNLTG